MEFDMVPYFDTQQKVLKVRVTNVTEFRELLEKAKRETKQLENTLGKLYSFELNFDFSVGTDHDGDMERASSDINSTPM